MIQEIKVSNCWGCPFVVNDNDYGYYICHASEEVTNSLKENEMLPEFNIHEKCPLKQNEIKVSLA